MFRFVADHAPCVVKTPFTTHGSPYRGKLYCKTYVDVLKRIKHLALLANQAGKHAVHRVPYVMIQPRIKNNTEYKVLVLDGRAKTLLTKAYGFKTPVQEIYEFAERVTAKLKQRYPETMTEYIIRVDLFEVEGKLKVNEFESFDADIFMAQTFNFGKRKFNQADDTKLTWTDEKTADFIRLFWIDKLHELISIAAGVASEDAAFLSCDHE
jgi:hypothetical protein